WRVPFPAAARISKPLPDAALHMRTAVQRNDAHFVDHLLLKCDDARRLHDLQIVVVGARQPRQRARDAALPQIAIFRTGGGTLPRGCNGVRALLALWRERRNASVRRIDDQGGASLDDLLPEA